MRALRLHGARDLRLEEVSVPRLTRGYALVAVEWCGICGSDLHEYAAGPRHVPHRSEHPLTGQRLPLTLGHEFAGTVVDVSGATPNGPGVGDLVTVNPILSDGTCPACRAGRPNTCHQLGFVGLSGDGGFADFVSVPVESVRRLPASVGTEFGALVEPLAVALHGVRRADVGSGDTALVVGAGPIGLSAVLCLQAVGVRDIAVVEPSPTRAELARRLGAVILDPDRPSGHPREAVNAPIAADGFDVVLEVAGREQALATSLRSVRSGGRVVSLAVWPGSTVVSMPRVVFGEVTVTGATAYIDEFDEVLGLMAHGLLDPRPLVTARLSLEAAVSEGFEELISPGHPHGKILVRVNGGH